MGNGAAAISSRACRGFAYRGMASQSSEGVPSSSPSSTTNSYISLGAFETMGDNEGRAATGIVYLEEAVRLQEAEYNNEADPRRKGVRAMGFAQSLMQVGKHHHQQQDAEEATTHYKRAFDLIQEAVAVRERTTEETMTDAARKALVYYKFFLSEICSSIGVAYNDLSNQDEALTFHQKALTLRKETVGKDHPSLAECLNNLGTLYFARGSLQKAVEQYEQALELLSAAAEGREEGAYVALTYYNMGLCHGGLGHHQAAGVAMKRALRIAEQAFGRDHRQVELIRETLRQGEAPPPRSTTKAQNQE